MQSVALFVLYLSLLLMILVWLSKSKRIGLPAPILIAAFLFKVTLGCAYGYLFLKYYGGDDTWMYHHDGLLQYEKLLADPQAFLKDLLPDHPFAASHGLLEKIHNYRMDLEYWLLIKPLACFDILSRGNYYINVLFFDFMVFPGPLLLFRLLQYHFPTKKTVLVVMVFFIPSTTFWLSGIRSEGWIFASMMFLIYYFHQWAIKKSASTFIGVITGLLGVFIFRSQFLFTLAPAWIAWLWSTRNPGKTLRYYGFVYCLALLFFFGSRYISPTHNLPSAIVAKQQEFSRLHGNTRFQLDSLQPSIVSFLNILPQSFTNTFLRPFIWEAKGGFQWMAAIDTMAFWLLILFAFLYKEPTQGPFPTKPLMLFLACYGVSQILLIGFVVPFPGAIVRYKIIPELFLLTLAGIRVDWKKIRNVFK